MNQLKTFVISVLIGVLLGLWVGVNIGKGKSIFSNPFDEAAIQQQLKKSGDKILEKSGEALEKGGKALQDKAKAPLSQ